MPIDPSINCFRQGYASVERPCWGDLEVYATYVDGTALLVCQGHKYLTILFDDPERRDRQLSQLYYSRQDAAVVERMASAMCAAFNAPATIAWEETRPMQRSVYMRHAFWALHDLKTIRGAN